jgi:hypothetical protein
MLERLRTQIGTAGLVVAIVALVAALGGGAYAATGGNSGKATASAKQGKQGKPGKTGKTGPAGPAGPAGPTGAKGDTGAAGAKGDTGATGATGAPGKDGKNGTNGKDGETGFTETLPSGKTETGSWLLPETASPLESTTISFAVPLAAVVESDHTKYIAKDAAPPTECENSAHAGVASAENPEASAGFLCVYTGVGEIKNNAVFVQKSGSPGFLGASTAGGVLIEASEVIGGGGHSAFGTWAVTAP